MRESVYQSVVIQKLRYVLPGCMILKNDSDYLQGIPDILVLFQNKWAMLEVKASAVSPSQPNQDYYIELFDSMSFAAFIYPENEEEVLYDLQQAFKSRRAARIPKPLQVSLDQL